VAAVLIQVSWKMIRKVVLMISRSSSIMDYLVLKTRSHCPNMENIVDTLISSNIFDSVLFKLGQDAFVKLIDWRSSNMGISDEKLGHRG
jgi:hypothetical protein